MTTRRRRRGTKLWVSMLLIALAATGLLLRSFAAAPLPPPSPFRGALPPSSAPPEMAVFQLPTGITHRSAAFAYRGGSFRDKRDFAMTAVLVRHPGGDLLVDTGFGRDIEDDIRLMPRGFQLVTRYDRARSAVEQLDAAHYDRSRLAAIILTHAHWDHASGLSDFPGVPVWVTTEERRFIIDGGALTAVARSFAGARFEEYGFPDGTYLGFPRSRDVYHDGSIVIVPAPGHTPGSVLVFLSLPTGKRHALLGDLVWQREGILEREERPWLLRTLADWDYEGVRESLLRMSAIAERFPEINLVPAHDARGFASMSRL